MKLTSYMKSLLSTFGLDYDKMQYIDLPYQASVQTITNFTAPCDGFLVLHGGANVTGVYIANYQRGGAIAHMNTNPANWQSCNAIVAKGETYELGVGWSAEAKGDSCGIFVPFNFCAT